MKSPFQPIQDTFNANLDSVYKLMEFDEIVQDFAIQALEKADAFLSQQGVADNHPSYSVLKELDQIRKIRTNESLKPHYQSMFNQCVVMLTSYFASAVESIFTTAISLKLESNPSPELTSTELKLKVRDLQSMLSDKSVSIAELIANQKDVSFQDTKSIQRAFSEYLGCSIQKKECVNNIILALACRHALVHAGGVVNNKTISQVADATPRQVKRQLSKDQTLTFTSDEVKLIAESMREYISTLISTVSDSLKPQTANSEKSKNAK
ncbi:MAG: hypothetical protein JXN61_07690 [Sedimentisphaerales bacterium]|nr:hypothetical protein [Sedimentisphaerales bacterium]